MGIRSEFATNKVVPTPILFQLVIEPSGAASLAAAFSDKLKTMDPKSYSVEGMWTLIISPGLDLTTLELVTSGQGRPIDESKPVAEIKKKETK